MGEGTWVIHPQRLTSWDREQVGKGAEQIWGSKRKGPTQSYPPQTIIHPEPQQTFLYSVEWMNEWMIMEGTQELFVG